TDQADNKSSYSNYGFKTVNIFAPGGSAQTPAPLYQILSLYPSDEYGYEIGTSKSAPVVSGLIALIKSLYPSLSNLQLINRVLSTGDNLLSLTGYSQTCNRVNGFNALSDETSPKICLDKHIPEDSSGYYYDFGVIDSEKKITFTIRSSGSANLYIGNVQLANGSVFKIIDDSCSGKSMAFGEECNITISAYSIGTGDVSDTFLIETNTIYGTINIQFRGTLNIEVPPDSGSGGGCTLNKNNGNTSLLPVLLMIFIFLIFKVIRRSIQTT
ncbi:MAG: S8 family serine peptidase, partial [Aquificae bacterium]|nr:S8 family serine peptidase [Aquificota bacterium]